MINFNFLAPVYDRIAGFLGYHYPEKMLRLLKLRGETGVLKILDIGGGTGNLADKIENKNPGPKLEFTIIDPSPKMLKQVPSRENFKTIEGCGEKLPFGEEAFDRIIITETLHHALDPQRIFEEAFRVLKRGGIMVVQEPEQRLLMVKVVISFEKLLMRNVRKIYGSQIENWGKNAGFKGHMFFGKRGQVFWRGIKPKK